jgi:hypothetical protein
MTVRKEEVGPGENLRDALLRTTENVYQSRWDFVNNLMIEFEDKQLDAEILLDKDIVAIGNKFRKCVRDIEFDLRLFLQMHSMEGIHSDLAFKKVSSTVVWSLEGEKDELNETITEIIRNIRRSYQDIYDFTTSNHRLKLTAACFSLSTRSLAGALG